MLHATIVLERGRFRLEVALEAAGVTAVMGPNGSGKSTLMHALLGAVRPRAGRIELDRRVLFDSATRTEVLPEERSIAYVPQGFGLFPHLSAIDNVRFGMRRQRAHESRERAYELLANLELTPAADRRPDALSGGEKQRVALARALATEPRLLLLDEPLGALDVAVRPRVRQFLAEWLRRTKLPALVVTHDAADARAFADMIVVLEAGRVAQAGSPQSVAEDPATDFISAFSAGLLPPKPCQNRE